MPQLELNLVSEINRLHSELCGLARTGIEKAIRIGELLTQQKELVKHGEWLPWITANLEFDRHQAFRYMAIYGRRSELNVASMQHLTMSEAYRLLSQPEEKESIDPNPQPEIRPQPPAPMWTDDPTPEITSNAPIEVLPPESSPMAHVGHNSGENEWYTPVLYIEAARAVMGSIDLDPASCDVANETVKARRIYTKKTNGLEHKWKGNVWMNPPYAQPLIAQFSEKVAQEYEDGNILQACVLVNNATDTGWFQGMMESATSICFPKGRIRFIDKNGNPSGAPLQGQAIIYFGDSTKKFREQFEQFGFVL